METIQNGNFTMRILYKQAKILFPSYSSSGIAETIGHGPDSKHF